ncbi:hypothetical protein EFN43_08395 [Pediococcus pentosaceus]|uniref:hypothetical protein n=1 Tax=Pediococcus pentosaceus TaxID=1255 RepID=UPI0021A7DE97|nr:hypothetical protein [Pediococcus pentosaceus]MCT3021076.1 hypothetical protein [Pediococcus pentosaceus]
MNNSYWKLLGLVIVVPVIIVFFQHIFSFSWFAESSNDGWLGFWGGFLGALISTIGVYKSVEKQIVMERAIDIENARPHLFVKDTSGDTEKGFANTRVVYSEDRFQQKDVTVNDVINELKRNNEHWLTVRNDSTKNVYNCVLFVVAPKEKDKYEIGSILPGQTINVVFSNPEWSKKLSELQILLDFTTEKNELVIYDASHEKSLFTSDNKEVRVYNNDGIIDRKEHFNKIFEISM